MEDYNMIHKINRKSKNPFQITTPEMLTADETVSLFVDVFTDFDNIIDSGHMFLTGPRGIGKSMMFRYLQSDCQCIDNNGEKVEFSTLPFVGVYIPIKNWGFVKTELKRLEDRHSSELINEHLMVSHIAIEVFNSISENPNAVKSINSKSMYDYYRKVFLPLLNANDVDSILLDNDSYSTLDILMNIKDILTRIYKYAYTYTQDISFSGNDSILPIYNGSLYDYLDFLVPMLSGLANIEGFSKNTIYLLMDDAHWLSEAQTRVLNSWIATRTSRKVSLKISTQYDYKTYYTVTGATIDSPHDYTEIDMSTVYTSNSTKSTYWRRISSIVIRRLEMFGIFKNPYEFFPADEEQERKILEIAESYKKRFDEGEGKGNKRSDDAYRYARPDFIKSLAGSSKSSATYSYSGFDQLVHLSSGIVRHFLETAHIMYSRVASLSEEKSKVIDCIPPSVQNTVSRTEASNYLYKDLEKYRQKADNSSAEQENQVETIPSEDIDHLSNLIQGLGGLFRQILLSDRSERRMFSIAISDKLSADTERVLKIGVNLGLFHESTIGRKNAVSGGRTKLFVMNRRLAPIWNLDPTGFSGYLFIKNDLLLEAMDDPHKMLRRIAKTKDLSDNESMQLNLFTLDGDHDDIEHVLKGDSFYD